MKLGKRSPSNKAALLAAHFLTVATGNLPAYPTNDPPPAGLVYPMDLNDRFGVCVVAAWFHYLAIVHAFLGLPFTQPTDAQIEALYREQNPNFDPASDVGDNGMDIQTFLEARVKDGSLLGFAKVDHTQEATMRAAAYVGLALLTGEVLQVAQQSGKIWDVVPGSPDWGGHCTATNGYQASPDVDDLVSWGDEYQMTAAFRRQRVEEAWLPIPAVLWEHAQFRDGFDQKGFAAAFTVLTGDPFPAPVPEPTPPPAPPAPPPAPVPGEGFDVPVPAGELADRIAHKAAGKGRSPADQALHNLEAIYRVPGLSDVLDALEG